MYHYAKSPLEEVVEYIDYFYTKNRHTVLGIYTEDSTAFTNKLESVKAPSDILMSSLDITSMNTNLHYSEIIDAVNRAWPKILECKFEIPIPPKRELLKLLKLALENNEFEFNGQIYKQKVGVPMGSPMFPSLTDLRMFGIISEILERFPSNISLLTIYRNDVFFSIQRQQATSFNYIILQITCIPS